MPKIKKKWLCKICKKSMAGELINRKYHKSCVKIAKKIYWSKYKRKGKSHPYITINDEENIKQAWL